MHHKSESAGNEGSSCGQRKLAVVSTLGTLIAGICCWLAVSPPRFSPTQTYFWPATVPTQVVSGSPVIPLGTSPPTFSIQGPHRILGRAPDALHELRFGILMQRDALDMSLLDLDYRPPPLDLQER
jgi:hypothetical protein